MVSINISVMKKAFIFSLVNKDKTRILMKCIDTNAIHADVESGPTFGVGFDFLYLLQFKYI